MNIKMTMLFLLTISILNLSYASSEKAYSYIEKYKEIAVLEMKKSGIPASIKLAQGMIESSWGESNLAKEANNHFGIKCGGNWQGPTYFKVDDDFDTDGKNIESCFRVYKDASESYVSHTDFLTDPNKKGRYGFLFNYSSTDYTSWAYGLKTAGYATDPNYPKKLIQAIEKFNLSAFDQELSIAARENSQILSKNEVAKHSTKADKALVYNKILKKYDLAFVYANGKDNLIDIAKSVNIPVRNLLAINETITIPQETVPMNSIIYLEKKHRDYEGEEEAHLVKSGETIEDISQTYGMRAATLRSINKMKRNDQVSDGDIIYLKPGNKARSVMPGKIEPKKSSKKQKEKEKSEYLFEF